MFATLFSYINSIHPVSEKAMHDLEQSFEVFDAPKKHVLVREGDTSYYLYLILSGLVRIYYIKDDVEVCSLFVEENYPFSIPNSFYRGKPGYQYIETLEPTKLARIHVDQLQRLYKLYPELNFAARVITERYFVKSEERLYLLRKQTAEERYIYFSERYPTLLQRVPLKYIASYLGMTLETLSRCRNKIRK